MHITNDIKYLGVNDHQVDFFEGQYIVPNGIAYNSYLIIDEKIAVMDTVDQNFGSDWLCNLEKALEGRVPDYLVILHMEPDHSANIARFLENYPETTIVGNVKTFKMIEQFFGVDYLRKIVVNDNDKLSLGKHELTFVFAPMVHWPEVMVAYESYSKVLFSADGFGKFGALDVEEDWVEEARRYYIGIVGKYGKQVQDLLKKAATLPIEIICPLHGPLLKENLGFYLGCYDKWSKYEAENDGILIAYTSIYGNTKKAVEIFVQELEQRNYKNYMVLDLARCDMHYAIGKAFEYSKLVLATTTYNNSIFPKMNDYINRLVERNFQNRTIGIIENGSWNPVAANTIIKKFVDSKNLFIAENVVTIHSSFKDNNLEEINALIDELIEEKRTENNMDLKALQKIEYGLYVVTSNDGIKDNGVIINTVVQLTNTPATLAVSINKDNYSHDIILRTKKLNVCTLDTTAPFKIFEQFGFQSGRDVDKFAGQNVKRSANGLVYLHQHSNAYLSLEVSDVLDLGTHSLFICEVVDAQVLNDKESMSYTYYHHNVKPNPQASGSKKGYVCTICGYVYEGEEIPDDYVCPLCLHGKEYFEPLK